MSGPLAGINFTAAIGSVTKKLLPTGKPLAAQVGAWVQQELAHATNEWRRQFRGEARVKDDSAVTESDIATHNLVLWGDPNSNQLLGRIASKLPMAWNDKQVGLGKKVFPGDHHAADRPFRRIIGGVQPRTVQEGEQPEQFMFEVTRQPMVRQVPAARFQHPVQFGFQFSGCGPQAVLGDLPLGDLDQPLAGGRRGALRRRVVQQPRAVGRP